MAAWPWSSICQRANHIGLTFQGHPWEVEKVVTLSESIIVGLSNACQSDTFAPENPTKYIRAISKLFALAEHDRYDKAIPFAENFLGKKGRL